MKKAVVVFILAVLTVANAQTPQKPSKRVEEEDVIRITTNLVQTDAVVTDKEDKIITDLKLSDFELYDNGKRQEIKFLEFVGVDTGKRVEGAAPALAAAAAGETAVATGVTAESLKRVIAFVVDDLTIPNGDMVRVRELLLDFVNNQMRDGDLVAIVPVVGGGGLLQQYTSDRQLLRRAVAKLTPKVHPFSVNAPNDPRADTTPQAAAETGSDVGTTPQGGLDAESLSEDVNKGFRTLMGLTTTNAVITSLRPLPGRKTVVLISGGLPLYESTEEGQVIDRESQQRLPVTEIRPLFTDIYAVINKITDNASRSGVVVNTMDVRGLQPRSGIRAFQDTPAKSALGMSVGSESIGGGGMDANFGRGPNASLIGGKDSLAGAQGLRALAEVTGGIASVNTNNFNAGLQKILSRSQGYYLLGYSPTDKFDAKFHKISIKVQREGARVYSREGYFAREELAPSAETTRENLVIKAALSPLARTELGVSTLIEHKFLASDKAELDIHLFIDPKTLHFTQSPEGHYRDSFDVAGFIFDQTGKARGGFSETVNSNLSPAEYQRALASGLSDSAHTELPPGFYQLRVVVRENDTGRVGTVSKYLEVPDLSKRQLTMSSLFLFAVDPKKSGNEAITPLQSLRRLTRTEVLRYAAVVYNPKADGNQTKLRTQLIVTQGNKVLFQEPDQPMTGQLNGIQIIKVGELVLAKVLPGKYMITLVVTDPLADKRRQVVSRSSDFLVVD